MFVDELPKRNQPVSTSSKSIRLRQLAEIELDRQRLGESDDRRRQQFARLGEHTVLGHQGRGAIDAIGADCGPKRQRIASPRQNCFPSIAEGAARSREKTVVPAG